MQTLLDDFRLAIETATTRLLAIPEADSLVPPGEGQWAPKQVIGHLIDSAANNHLRFVQAQFTDHLVFAGYEQETWVDVQRYDLEPWPRLVELWRLYNLHLCHLMSVTPEQALKTERSRHSLQRIAFKTVREDEPTTLEYLMRDYVDHLHNHLRQIFRDWKPPHRPA